MLSLVSSRMGPENRAADDGHLPWQPPRQDKACPQETRAPVSPLRSSRAPPSPDRASREPQEAFHLPMSKCLWPEVTIPSVPKEETSGQVSPPGAKCAEPRRWGPTPVQELTRYRNGGLSEPQSHLLRSLTCSTEAACGGQGKRSL